MKILQIISSFFISIASLFAPVDHLGTASGDRINYTQTLLPSVTASYDLGTTSLAYREAFVGNLTVSGTCTGCAGASADMQDAYNASASDAQITTASAKNIVNFLQNTATDANYIINIDTASDGKFLIQNSSSGAATTTSFSVDRWGRTGLGTSTPGSGLSVHATSTLLGGDAYIYGQLNIPYLVSTSSTASLFTGDIGSSANRVPNIWATNLNTTLITVGSYAAGDFTISSDLYVNGGQFALGTGSATSTLDATATSTWQGGLVVGNTALKGGLQVVNGGLNIAGDSLFSGKLTVTNAATSSNSGTLLNSNLLSSGSLYVSGVATSSFEGGIQVKTLGGLASASGLTVTGGQIQSSGKLVVTDVATSSFSGGLSVSTVGGLSSLSGLTVTGEELLTGKLIQLVNATSSFTGGLIASSSIAVTGRVVASPAGACESGSGLINFGEGTGGCISVTGSTIISVENALPNQKYALWIYHDHTGSNSNLGWASTTNGYVFYFPNGKATTTTGSITGILDICSLLVQPTSTPQAIAVQCVSNMAPGS